jgi:hypothetical protein
MYNKIKNKDKVNEITKTDLQGLKLIAMPAYGDYKLPRPRKGNSAPRDKRRADAKLRQF